MICVTNTASIPPCFFPWQLTLFEHLSDLFEPKSRTASKQKNNQVELLKQKLTHKDEVIAQIMEDFVVLEKALRNPDSSLGFSNCS